MTLQTFAADSNAAEFTSMELGISIKIPLLYSISLFFGEPPDDGEPPRIDGGVEVTIGSGKFGTP